jgi:hypothetical protein
VETTVSGVRREYSRYAAPILYASSEAGRGDRVVLLADRYLAQADLWLIICDYNDIFFPLELTPACILRIPSVEHGSMPLLD